MKTTISFVILLAVALSAQTPPAGSTPQAQPAKITPETVVATLDGKPVSAAEIQAVLRTFVPQGQQAALRDPQEFLRRYAMIKRLTDEAEKNKLDQKSPYKEALAASRMQVLYQAQVQETYNDVEVRPEDQQKFYEANKDRWVQAKVKVIYIPFTSTPPPQSDAKGKKALTEEEAKAKAEELVKQIRAGADFVKLVKEHSEDPTSAAKDGDYPPISKADKIPDNIKAAVFALKKGEVSDPVRAPNGYYIFRAEEITVKPFDEVRSEIYNELKLAGLREFLETTQKSVQVKIENEAFFKQALAGASAAQPAK